MRKGWGGGWVVLLLAIGWCCPAWSELTNHVVNAKFTDIAGDRPSGWDYFATQGSWLAVTNWMGELCVELTAQEKANAFQGIVQRVPVESGEKYTVAAQVLNSKENPLKGSAYAQLVVEWLADGDREVGRSWSERVDLRLSRMQWTWLTLRKVVVPKDASAARVGIHFFDGDQHGKGSLFVRQVQLLTY